MQRNNHATPLSPGRRAARHDAIWVPALVAFLLVPCVSVNAQQVPPGVVVFSHEDSGSPNPTQQFWNIWSLDPQNPGNQVQITTFTGPPVLAGTSVWKKDFTQLAFNSNFNGGLASLEVSSIFSMNPDGSNLAQITGFGVLNPLPPPTGTVIGSVQAPPLQQIGAGHVSGCVISVQGAPQNASCPDGATFVITGVPVGSNWVRVQAQVSYDGTLAQPGLSVGWAPITVMPDAVTDAGTVVVSPQFTKSIEPTWSRDGTQVVVTNEQSGQVLVESPPFSNNWVWTPFITHQLNVWSAGGQFVGAIPSPAGFEYIGSDWSPVADRLAFASNGSSAFQSFVTVANPDGSNPGNIYQVPIDFTGLRFVTFCRWSPDGQRIAFIEFTVPTVGSPWSDLYVVNSDGTAPQVLVHSSGPGGFVLVPAWSPDSQAIAFQFSTGSDPLNLTSSNLYVVGADGSYLVPLTTDGRSTSPAWGPPPM